MKPSYIQSIGIYPSPRNTPFRLLPGARPFDQSRTEERSMLGYRTFADMGKNPQHNFSVHPVAAQTSQNFFRDSGTGSDHLMDRISSS